MAWRSKQKLLKQCVFLAVSGLQNPARGCKKGCLFHFRVISFLSVFMTSCALIGPNSHASCNWLKNPLQHSDQTDLTNIELHKPKFKSHTCMTLHQERD